MLPYIIDRKMGPYSNPDGERESLVDYVVSHPGLAESLDYAVGVLHRDITLFKRMLDHAHALRGAYKGNGQYDIGALVGQLGESELPYVRAYLRAVANHIAGEPFDPVRKTASELLRLRPVQVRTQPQTPEDRRIGEAMELHY
jgi:hypothetical protein